MNYISIQETSKKTSEIIAEMRKNFDVWSYLSDVELDRQFPAPQQKSVRHFGKHIESDPELAGMSAQLLERRNIPGITLRERLLMELEYFKSNGKHLDTETVTMCSGSRDAGGSVPFVDWDDHLKRVCIDWNRPTYSYRIVRSRQAFERKI